ncbi:dTDP-4-amino-4,6-dideoxygalactose transaminase [Caloranaerobacter azorensis DSM 13643]|uniref:dTDP-4-amino-4,6-dideoxygalactose transaminase n=1 Tax=Caloranaerobacter azorensis DSM 13643 TaxID=1121264 RepID=A0A1M5SZJ2_9FIRM|nr:DegT/DnrJ/EryC1/StrS family aminotransferase [Caloranaerobacter azorensis]SHH43909.1 dTDP-4-amino-4,6-dideoxygalactose transaminase [Caloranaerobacter azorensis DSM 13643]
MTIQLFKPTFRVEECLEEIRECLEKGWTGLGFKTIEFEEKWKEYTGFKNAHFLNSATAGLHLAIKILKMTNGWQDGDEIISTPLTFVSTNHAIAYEGLKVVFADVDEYLCLDPKDVERKITNKTKAILFVGLGGSTGKYEEIVEICKRYKLKLIIDAAHMAGTRLNGEIPGKEADVLVYSFQAVKNLPTADSGMICFKEEKYDKLCREMTWLGINKDTYARTNDKGVYKWKYDVEYLGYKYHGNSIMAAIGLVQLKYLDIDNAYRRQLAKWYDEGFKNHLDKIKPIRVPINCESSRHLYIIEVNNRDDLLLALNENDIYPGVHYRDNTEYRMYSYAKGTCPNAHRMSNRVLSLPMHLRMTKYDVDYICEKIIKYSK